MDIENVASI